MPIRRAVLIIRQAISPRLAIRMRLNMQDLTRAPFPANLACEGSSRVTILSCQGVSSASFAPRRQGAPAMTPRSLRLPAAALAVLCLAAGPADAQSRHNLVLFVPDGLRALSVTPDVAPAMAAVRDHGVNFANPHSLFPTFTMTNA